MPLIWYTFTTEVRRGERWHTCLVSWSRLSARPLIAALRSFFREPMDTFTILHLQPSTLKLSSEKIKYINQMSDSETVIAILTTIRNFSYFFYLLKSCTFITNILINLLKEKNKSCSIYQFYIFDFSQW